MQQKWPKNKSTHNQFILKHTSTWYYDIFNSQNIFLFQPKMNVRWWIVDILHCITGVPGSSWFRSRERWVSLFWFLCLCRVGPGTVGNSPWSLRSLVLGDRDTPHDIMALTFLNSSHGGFLTISRYYLYVPSVHCCAEFYYQTFLIKVGALVIISNLSLGLRFSAFLRRWNCLAI